MRTLPEMSKLEFQNSDNEGDEDDAESAALSSRKQPHQQPSKRKIDEKYELVVVDKVARVEKGEGDEILPPSPPPLL